MSIIRYPARAVSREQTVLAGTFDTAASDGAVTNLTGNVAGVVRSAPGEFTVTFEQTAFSNLVVTVSISTADEDDDVVIKKGAVSAANGTVVVFTATGSTGAGADKDATVHVIACGTKTG